MKLLSKITLVLGLFLGQVFAATGTSGVDENGRLWGSAYFDIHSGVQSPVLGAIKYTNRAGFNWDNLYSNLKNFSANQITYKIAGRIVVPDNITTNQVYITFGKNIRFWDEVYYNETKIWGTADYLKSNNSSVYKLFTSVNKVEMVVADEILEKVKTDEFGTNYVDFEINLYIQLATKNINSAKGRVFKVIENNYAKTINSIRIKIAPKSRSYADKWQSPKIYVMD